MDLTRKFVENNVEVFSLNDSLVPSYRGFRTNSSVRNRIIYSRRCGKTNALLSRINSLTLLSRYFNKYIFHRFTNLIYIIAVFNYSRQNFFLMIFKITSCFISSSIFDHTRVLLRDCLIYNNYSKI